MEYKRSLQPCLTDGMRMHFPVRTGCAARSVAVQRVEGGWGKLASKLLCTVQPVREDWTES
jgi:hypothetical protein